MKRIFTLMFCYGLLVGSALAEVPAKVPVFTDVITQPEGETRYMILNTDGYVLWGEQITEYEGEFASKVIYGANNDIYLYNPLPMTPTGSYLKGKIQGDKVIIDIPQTILKQNIGSPDIPIWEGYNLTILKVASMPGPDGQQITTYVPDETKTSIEYKLYDDGSMTLEGLGKDSLIGTVYTTTSEWTGDGALHLNYSPYYREPETLPEGIKLEDYGAIAGENGFIIKTGFEGDAVYFVGLLPYIPDAVIKGTLKDGIVSIDQNQFVGIFDGYFITTKCGRYERKGSKKIVFTDGPYTMTFNGETKEFQATDPDQILIFNAEEDEVKSFVHMMNVCFRYQDSMSGTPANPFGLKYLDSWQDLNGFYTFQFDVPNVATNGNVIDIENMYYSIFIDGELMEFSREEGYYSGIPEDEIWDELPCTFNNGFDIIGNGSTVQIGIYPDGVTTIGVQLYYYEGKERTASNLMYLNLENGKVYNSIDDPEADTVISTEYFDLNGRKVENPAAGLFVRRQILEDGKTRVSKIMRR